MGTEKCERPICYCVIPQEGVRERRTGSEQEKTDERKERDKNWKRRRDGEGIGKERRQHLGRLPVNLCD